MTSSVNWITIILSIIGSSAFSYIIALLTANRVKKAEFNWEYKSYILEKRKAAYEALNQIIVQVFISHLDEFGNKYIGIFLPKANTEQSLTTDIINKIQNLNIYKYWYSKKMRTDLNDFSNYFSKKAILYEKATNDEKLRLSIDEYYSMSQYGDSLLKQYWNDIQTLADIDNFIKEK